MNAAPLLLQGRVLDAQGRGVAGARIAWVSGPVDLPDLALLSGADGSFTLAAPVPGRYSLRADAQASDGTALQAQATLQLPQDSGPLELRLQR